MGLVSLLFSFKGRINRAQYWLGNIGVGVGSVLLIFMLAMVMGSPTDALGKPDPMAAVRGLALVLLPVSILMGWCGLAIQVKRLHDRGRSGLWSMAPMAPMAMIMITLVTGVTAGTPAPTLGAQLQPWLLTIWMINFAFFIDLGCLPSKDGPNKYDGGSPGSSPVSAPKSVPAGSSGVAFLGSAEKAIERAVAEQKLQPQRAAQAAPRPAMAHSPAAPTGFGRKPAR